MASCPRCRSDLSEGALSCASCGAALGERAAFPADPLVGRTFIDKYRIERLIGEGGFGRVYLATQLALDRRVALKILHAPALSNPAAVQRFHREARAASRLNHPNVVSVLDFGESGDGSFFIAMELLAGRSLRRFMDDLRPLQETSIVNIADQILSALAEAHAVGVIHRDLKPDNVFVEVDRGGREVVKVLDFGIARIQDDPAGIQTRDGLIAGTPLYMSPEQWRGSAVDGRSDLYAVGVILYEMLAGRRPFDGGPMEIALKALSADPEPPSAHLDRPVSLALEAVVMRALSRDPDRRPADADSMRRELRAALEQHPKEVAPSRALRPEAAPRARWIMPLGLAAGAAVVGAGLALVRSAPTVDTHSPPGLRLLLVALAALALPVAAVKLAVWRRGRRAAPAAAATPEPPGAAAPQPADAHAAEATRSIDLRAVAPLHPAAAVPAPGSATQVFRAEGLAAAAPDALSRAVLVVTECGDRLQIGRTVSIACTPFSIGRAASCNLAIADPGVSRSHAVIELRDGAYWITDTGSSNGVLVGGRRIVAAEPLLFGAEIRLGGTSLTFAYGGSPLLPDLSGTVVDGRYELMRLMRRSVKAAVYEASDRRVPQRIAVKILSPEVASFAAYADQFEREACLAAKLQHPNILSVIDFGEASVPAAEGRSQAVRFLCMRMLPGGNLAEKLADLEKPSLEQISTWISRVADALDHAHRNGVVHAGLKPTSIVFDADGNPFLTDFAIAYARGTAAAGAVVGAPAFLSPEQWASGEVGPHTDQFALAAIAYLLIAGAPPFIGQERPDARRRNFAAGPLPVHGEAAQNGRPGVPPAVSTVLATALSVDPARRYGSAVEFARAFESASRGRRLAGSPPRVFLSYVRGASGGWANHIAAELRARHQVDVYVDTQCSDGAGQFPDRIRSAIEDCDVFVCLLDKKTLASSWVREEIRLAHDRAKPMLPVFQERYQIPRDVGSLEPPIAALLRSDGLRLFDRQNIHVDHTISDLAKLVVQTVSREEGSERGAGSHHDGLVP